MERPINIWERSGYFEKAAFDFEASFSKNAQTAVLMVSKDIKFLVYLLIGYSLLILGVAFLIHKTQQFTIGQTGTLGDTFGGLLSPFIGLVTIYFVLKSYKKQQETHELEITNTNYEILIDSINTLYKIHSITFDKKIEEVLSCIYEFHNIRTVASAISGRVVHVISTEDNEIRYEMQQVTIPTSESIVADYNFFKNEINALIKTLEYLNLIINNYNTTSLLPIQKSIIDYKLTEHFKSKSFILLNKHIVNDTDKGKKILEEYDPKIYSSQYPVEIMFNPSTKAIIFFKQKEEKIRSLLVEINKKIKLD